MRINKLILGLLGVLPALAQVQIRNQQWGNVAIEFQGRLEPQTTTHPGWGGAIQMFPTHNIRSLTDPNSKISFYYQIRVELLKPGARLRLHFSPANLAAKEFDPNVPTGYQRQTLIATPASADLELGGVVLVELLANPTTGQKVFDAIRLISIPGPLPPQTSPSASARPFTVNDVELTLASPRLRIDGQAVPMPFSEGMRLAGAIGWVYHQGLGRFDFSLAPRAAEGFRPLGVVSQAELQFQDGGHTIRLECEERIAPSPGTFHIFVRQNRTWRPPGADRSAQTLFGADNAP